jgi:N6-L-threonylcarbamoyladenine synthase/protein kinase Bud32
MIAYTGKIMLESGCSLPLEESWVNPSYRSDQVQVTWRDDADGPPDCRPSLAAMTHAAGAEAVVTLSDDEAVKRRIKKSYRAPALDQKLITERTRAEARIIVTARRSGVSTPIIRDITPDTIIMERIHGNLLRDILDPDGLAEAGRSVGRLHKAGIVHGDLTTSNIIICNGKCILIDFGLSQISTELESRGVDVHVLFQTLQSTTPDAELLKSAFIEGYTETCESASEVLSREEEIEMRGRYL